MWIGFNPINTPNSYSVGVVYITILNLPRHLRNKPNNIILVGILPGPHEPKHDMNSYINPLVEELKTLWHGKEMTINGFASKQVVQCALLSAACDLPAGRKLCGFISFNAHYGCTKCWKKFAGEVGSFDFSGFDREQWSLRTRNEHRMIGDQILQCQTKSQRSKLEYESGYRYTSLLELTYFDPSRMLIIDPMHNLFLGTTKHVLKSIWLDTGILDSDDYSIVQSRIDNVNAPSDIGRIPHKVLSGFSSLTADQLKNWVLYYSILSLKDRLHGEHRECWRHFVLACRLLCKKSISNNDILLADALLMQYCRRTEQLYGKNKITPNMHLHAHLKTCIDDYGPLHGFWLFSYERFNAILGSQPNNNRSIEIQLMARFIRDCHQLSMPLPDQFEEFSPLFNQCRRIVGTVSETINSSCISFPPVIATEVVNWDLKTLSHIDLPPHSARATFTSAEKEGLRKLYAKLFLVHVPPDSIEINTCFIKYKSILMYGKQIGTYRSRSSSSSTIMCQWDSFLLETSSSVVERPVRVNYFAKHSVSICGKVVTLLLLSASWFKIHEKINELGPPITIWECDIFENPDISIIPVHYIKSRTVTLIDESESYGHALYVVPCVDF